MLYEVKGQLKLVHKKAKDFKTREVGVVAAAIAELQELQESWRTAEGTALAEKCLAWREGLLEEIEALEYAKKKKLKIYSGYGDLAERRRIYDDFSKLSDEDLQSKVIEEIQITLDELSP